MTKDEKKKEGNFCVFLANPPNAKIDDVRKT